MAVIGLFNGGDVGPRRVCGRLGAPARFLREPRGRYVHLGRHYPIDLNTDLGGIAGAPFAGDI